MNTFTTLMVVIVCFVVILLVFFAISSCLGDDIRAHFTGRRRRVIPTTYGLQYARMMGQSGNAAGWEQIEMQDMFDETEGRGR